MMLWDFASPPMPACPIDMVWATNSVCIDRLPYPNYEGEPPLVGLSATPENYLPLGGETWDAESLCASRGKRLCTWHEWQRACEGTEPEQCQPLQRYIAPEWGRVAERDPLELLRLDQHASASDYPQCVSRSGARLMIGNVQEWVRYQGGHAFSRSYWSRPGDCHALTTAHDERWHDYATSTRCCLDAPLPPITFRLPNGL